MEPYVYPQGCVFNSLEDIAGKKITVMGLGLNGGGEACVKFFLKHGAYVTVTDMKTPEQLAPTLKRISEDAEIDKSRLSYVLGRHNIEDFENADCVIKNPGVKIQGNEYLAAAKAIETDLSIFLHFTKAPIIAVTGSKGKSSTVSAIEFGLKNAGFKTFLGGNITVSPLTFLHKTDGMTPVVLELSSWQLADLRGRKALKPKIAIITKIVPDHQNWYDGMDSYVNDKKLIYADQDETDFTILDFDPDDYLTETAFPKKGCSCWGDLFASETKAQVMRYSSNVLPLDAFGAYQAESEEDGIIYGYSRLPKELMSKAAKENKATEEKIMGELMVPGAHMRTNVLNAALVMRLMHVSPEQTMAIVDSWKGIAHRLEHFSDWKNPYNSIRLSFYNDTCATVPEASAAAAMSFDSRVILIAGGTDKNLDFTPLYELMTGRKGRKYIPQKLYLLSGTGTDKLTAMLDQKLINYSGPYDSLGALLGVMKTDLTNDRAEIRFDYFDSSKPIPVVFSPGATSFGMFANEFDRGNKFKDSVTEMFG
ncbi:MAG: UDP-N-acetylmuramoyl-L-alanine--D-glutamate ligase [Treponema sp.]|nr:UDP-N-acetylmuramoyl-L-alanine--D-glutamate ligase [Treponema sp.]